MLLESPDRGAAALRAYARETTRRCGRTFALACRLLPRDVRDDVHLLYLVLRTLDDLVDHGLPEAPDRLAAIETWCTGESADSPEVRVLQDLELRHDLPRDALRDFCLGMRDDLAGRTPRTEEEVDRYCYRVAGTVGLLLCAILGTTGDPARARDSAIALGIAMQRTNVLRDLDEDAQAGRCYVAAEALERHGPPLPGARAALLRDQIARADARYEEALAGLHHLRSGRRAVAAAAAMYREILRQIEREGLGARPGRAVVPTRRRLLVGARALRHAGQGRGRAGRSGPACMSAVSRRGSSARVNR